MGIPSYFRKLLENYPKAHFWKNDMKVDNMFVDFNSMVYNVLNNIPVNSEDYEGTVIRKTVEYLKHVVDTVRPRKFLYIAMDGVPPKAKMVQQRARRYKVLKEESFIRELERKYDVKIPRSKWNKASISPGTIFMSKLSRSIMASIKGYDKSLKIVFSDESVVGEGEHKLLPCLKNVVKGETSVVYSPDADMIVLSIMSGVNDVYILREPKDSIVEIEKYANNEFLYLSIDECKKGFMETMCLDPTNYLPILSDYSFLTFLCGNDFVMAAPFLKMKEGGMDTLLDIYLETSKYFGGTKYLVHEGRINNVFLKKLLENLSVVEQTSLQKWQRKRDRVRKGFRSPKREEVEKGKEPWEVELIRFNHEEYYSPLHPQYKYYNRVFDTINYYSDDWEEMYNKHFFGNNDIKEVCREYYKSLDFCLQYYNLGVPSWTWHYKFRASPSMKEFSKYVNEDTSVHWDVSEPYTQFEQLMYILPKQSHRLLPRSLNDGELVEYYPNNFMLDIVQGTKYIYSDPVLDEFLDHETIRSKIARSVFSSIERKRNTLRCIPFTIKDKI